MKKFNVTGNCIPEENYMVDIGGKIEQIKKMIDDKHYFTINRARQYGKTTTLAMLERAIKDEYLVASISFQGLDDSSFATAEKFCRTFTNKIQWALEFADVEAEYTEKWVNDGVADFMSLDRHIAKMCRNKKLVLMIDEADYRTGMDMAAIAGEIHAHTDGYPFLVSRICQCIDEEGGDWTTGGIRKAIDILLAEHNTLFDDMFKNLENNADLYTLIYDMLIVGEKRTFNIDNPVLGMASMYGIIKNGNPYVGIANRIFEMRICEYFISKEETNPAKKTNGNGVLKHDVVKDGRFDMERCLRKFAEHYEEIYSEGDMKFLERHGRLLFLSYLKPLINGGGYYHIESEFTDLRRMDIVVDYGREQFIVELKLWRGEQHEREAYEQLLGYMDSKRADTGYLLTFDFRKGAKKQPKAEWVAFGGKKIFEVIA